MKSVCLRISIVTAMTILVGLSNLLGGIDVSVKPTGRKNLNTPKKPVQNSTTSIGARRQLSDPGNIRKTTTSLHYDRYTTHSGEEVLSNRFPKEYVKIPHPTPDHATTGSPQTFVVTSTADTGEGSFRKAIHDANANPGPDSIIFNINGGGIQTIKPTTFYEVITSPVVIDGTTQPGYVNHPVIEIDGENQASAYPRGLEIDAQD